jgi:hypothetical protein
LPPSPCRPPTSASRSLLAEASNRHKDPNLEHKRCRNEWETSEGGALPCFSTTSFQVRGLASSCLSWRRSSHHGVVRAEIESVQEIERVIALFEKVDLEHNGKVDKGTHTTLALQLLLSGYPQLCVSYCVRACVRAQPSSRRC